MTFLDLHEPVLRETETCRDRPGGGARNRQRTVEGGASAGLLLRATGRALRRALDNSARRSRKARWAKETGPQGCCFPLPLGELLMLAFAQTPTRRSIECGRGTCQVPDGRRRARTESRTPSHPSLWQLANRTGSTDARPSPNVGRCVRWVECSPIFLITDGGVVGTVIAATRAEPGRRSTPCGGRYRAPRRSRSWAASIAEPSPGNVFPIASLGNAVLRLGLSRPAYRAQCPRWRPSGMSPVYA